MVTVADIRNASKEQKQTIVDERFANVKPVTNTSGTANTAPKRNDVLERLQYNIGKGVDPIAATFSAMIPGMDVGSRGGKTFNYYESKFRDDVRAGKYYNQPTAPKTTPATSGIDAPAPDQGWQPSGLTVGIPIQEQIGVTKRKKR